MTEEFQRQVASVFQQWDSDLDKTKDQEEKLAVRHKGDLRGGSANWLQDVSKCLFWGWVGWEMAG